MPQQVCTKAMMTCSMGLPPALSMFNATPRPVMTSGAVAGVITDCIPILNVPPFGACTSPANPAVVAAMGAPVPCMPVLPSPWVPGVPNVLIGNIPALDNKCKLFCAWAGVISIIFPGQVTHLIP